MNLSGGSYVYTGIDLSSRAAAHGRIAWSQGRTPCRLVVWSGQRRHAPASVVQPLHERAERREADDAQRAWIDVDPLVQIEVQAKAIGQDGLDHVAVRADQIRPFRAEPGVPVADRRDGAALHVGQRFTALTRKCDGTRMGLNYLPERLTRKLAQRLACPVTVADLDEPFVGLHGRLARLLAGGDRL